MKITCFSYGIHGFEGSLYDAENGDDRLLIVLQGLKGLELPEKYAKLFSMFGYSCLAMTYYGAPGLPSGMRAVPLEMFQSAVDAVRKYGSGRFRRIGIYGNSRGAGMALLAASAVPEISLVIAVSPFGHIMQGDGRKNAHSCRSMVRWKNKDYPYVPKGHLMSDFVFRCVREKNVRLLYFFDEWERRGDPENEIPVENIHGDILFLTARNDESVPAEHDADLLVNRLKRNHFPYQYRHLNSPTGSHNLGYYPVNSAFLPRERKYPEECRQAREDALNVILAALHDWGVSRF